MSTGWNLECLDHPHAPRWLAEDWNGSGDGPALRLAALWRQRGVLHQLVMATPANSSLAVEVEWDGYRRVTEAMMEWSYEHLECHVELVNEYGDRIAVDTMLPVPPRHCPTCSCPPR